MRKLVFIFTALLITTTAYSFAHASINAPSLAKTILSMHTNSAAKKSNINLVYGGQDISGNHISLAPAKVDPAHLLA